MKFPHALLVLAAICGPLPADESTFDTAPDSFWTRFDPTYQATFDFSNYFARLSCGVMPQDELEALYYQYGESVIFPRAVLFAPTGYADACVSVDLVAWNATTNRSNDGQFHAIFTRIQPGIGLASVFGYGASVIDLGNGNAELQINSLINEFPLPLTDEKVFFPLNPEATYRLVFCSRDDVHTARVFDLATTTEPVAELRVFDGTYASGRTGFGVLTDRLVMIDATFDNFLTWDASPPPLVIEPGTDPGTIVLMSDLQRSMGSDLETATDLSGPWQPAVPASAETTGGQLRLVFAKDQPRRFFRRKSL